MTKKQCDVVEQILRMTTEFELDQIKWECNKYDYMTEPSKVSYTIKVWTVVKGESNEAFFHLNVAQYIPDIKLSKYITYNEAKKRCELIIN